MNPHCTEARGFIDRRKPWTEEQKRILMEAADGRGINADVARRVPGHHSLGDCQHMYEMLYEYAHLGKPRILTEKGVRIMLCPPAPARGIFASPNVGSIRSQRKNTQ